MSEMIGDISDLIGGVGRVDPEDVTREDAATTAAQIQMGRDREMQAKVARVFAEGEGAEVLDWLRAITIDRAVVPYELIGAMSPDERMAHAHFREGENEVVRNICLAIQAHRRGESDGTEP